MRNSNQSSAIADTFAVPDTTNTTDTLRDTLAQLIDTKPFTQVVATLARVCHAKAGQIRSTSVDEHLAQAWEYNANQIRRVAKIAHATDPTITLRAAKLGMEPEELQRRIDTLPEPLRVIAMDYAYGALPPSGRSSAMQGILRDIIERIKAVPAGEDDLEARRRAA